MMNIYRLIRSYSLVVGMAVLALFSSTTMAMPFGVSGVDHRSLSSVQRGITNSVRHDQLTLTRNKQAVPLKKNTIVAPSAPSQSSGNAGAKRYVEREGSEISSLIDGSAPAETVQARPKQVVRSATIEDQAFSNAARILFPMSPEKVGTLHYLSDQTERASSAHSGPPPRPTTTELSVNISPGSTPPVIRLAKGFVSTILLLDSTSAPWPIDWVDVGNPKDFNVHWDKKGNVLLIQAMKSYRTANIALKLKGMSTPVMLTLMSGQKEVDYRIDLRVPGLGPNASSMMVGLPSAGNSAILSVLNGIPPSDSKTLQVLGGPAKAWFIKGQLYLRSRLNVLSPAWVSKVSSGDGMNVFVLPVSPIVLAMAHGKMVTLHIKQ